MNGGSRFCREILDGALLIDPNSACSAPCPCDRTRAGISDLAASARYVGEVFEPLGQLVMSL